MDFYWVYAIPNWLFCILVLLVTNLFAVLGLIATRPLSRKLYGDVSEHNEIVNNYISGIGVFYSITLGLLAAGVWERYQEVNGYVEQEAAAVATLMRSVNTFPLTERTAIRQNLIKYTEYVVKDAWPLQRKGVIPTGDLEFLAVIQSNLFLYEPETDGRSAVHFQLLQQFNDLLQARRLRLQYMNTGLSKTVWGVVIGGALVTFALTWLLIVENLRVHIVLTIGLAMMIGLLLYLMAAMDNPFRSRVGISPQSFQIIHDQAVRANADQESGKTKENHSP